MVEKEKVETSLVSDDKGKETVPKSRLDEVIGERNVLRGEKEGWTTKEKELMADIEELGEYKELRTLANSDPEFAKAIMEAIEVRFGKGADKTMKGKVPAKIADTGRSEVDTKVSALEQKIDDMEIEKHFDSIGVKEEEIGKLTEFCKKQRISMTNRTLLKMAYNEVFPKEKETEEDDKKKEPDSSTASGLDYGDTPIKSVRDAINFALKSHKEKK